MKINLEKVIALTRDLQKEGAPTGELWAWIDCVENEAEIREVTDLDRAWKRTEPLPIEYHLGGPERPILSTGLCEGRAYSLSTAQREVIREWFNATMSPTVVAESVVEFAEHPGIVREVILRSEQHVDPKNKALMNGPRSFVIGEWGKFCSAVVAAQDRMRDQKEVDSMTATMTRLLRRAKKEKVTHSLRSPTDVVHQWHAAARQEAVEQRIDRITPERRRELLREILRGRGEDVLAEMVKEPTPQGGATAQLEKDFDQLMEELGE